MFFVSVAPWTLFLIPVVGVWYIVFLSQFLIYDQLNKELGIEEKFEASQPETPSNSPAQS